MITNKKNIFGQQTKYKVFKFCLAHLDFLKRRNIKFNKMCVITACFRIKHVEHPNILTFHVKDKFNKK